MVVEAYNILRHLIHNNSSSNIAIVIIVMTHMLTMFIKVRLCFLYDIHVENEDVSLNCHLYTPYLQSVWSLILVTISWLLNGQLF